MNVNKRTVKKSTKSFANMLIRVWGGSRFRREPPLESLEKSLQLNKDMPAETQSMLSEVKHLCKKSAKRSSDD